MAYGKKRRFSKKSSRKGSRKYRRRNDGKSVKVRIAKVERVLRKRRPELKHRMSFPPTLVAATKQVDIAPNPVGGSGAFFGPGDGLWVIQQGSAENQRIGGSLSFANATAVFRLRPPEPSGVWCPALTGYAKRYLRCLVVQFRNRESILPGNSIIPYTDVENSFVHSVVDFEKKEQNSFKILSDRKIETHKYELGGNTTTLTVNQYAYVPVKEFLTVSLKPHWPLIWDDDATNPTQPLNPIYVYFYDDMVGNSYAGAEHTVVFLRVQHVFRDNS